MSVVLFKEISYLLYEFIKANHYESNGTNYSAS
jgi:hypothetical protein